MKKKELYAKKYAEKKPMAVSMIAYTSYIDGYDQAIRDSAEYVEKRSWPGLANTIRTKLGNEKIEE